MYFENISVRRDASVNYGRAPVYRLVCRQLRRNLPDTNFILVLRWDGAYDALALSGVV